MAPSNGDFSRGKVSSVIIRLGLPIMLAELVHVLYNIVDRMYIGHMSGTGTLALTGIGICFPLITLIGAFANLFSTGGATLSTIARGEGKDGTAGVIMDTSFTLLILTGAALTALLYPLAPQLLTLLGADAETLPAALAYFRIYVLGTVPVLIGLGMNPFINALGFPKTGMVTVILGAALNIVLDPLFIFTLRMGVAGAALATVISQTAGAVWVLLFLRGRRTPIRLSRFAVDRYQTGRLLKLGVTGFTFKITNSVTQSLVNITLRAWGGPLSTLYVGAMSLINSLREILSLPNNGVTTGAQNVMSYNYGAAKPERVSAAIRFTLLCGLGINLIAWGLTQFLPEAMLRVFTDDGALISAAVRCVRIYFGAFPFMALQLTGQSTFVALNYPKHALFFSLLRKVLLVTPLTLLLPGFGFGVEGVFWAELISQAVGATACCTTMYLVIGRRLRGGSTQTA